MGWYSTSRNIASMDFIVVEGAAQLPPGILTMIETGKQ